MPYVEVHVDASEVLEALDYEDLMAEVARREKKTNGGQVVVDERYLLEQIWLHYRGKDVPWCSVNTSGVCWERTYDEADAADGEDGRIMAITESEALAIAEEAARRALAARPTPKAHACDC